ncbi:hypothetical protein FNV43_RR07503 [Rhamnella rubrinervis]|uniref:Homeobox domain-containing protein n=1 Tax=Rhamnella rubrinervis TaxID=2594499 RepID=A0A8K0HGS4_9ROSA|nr:hypothetical protein FNV43_RR07503 [Rhamnella rubrinervis]
MASSNRHWPSMFKSKPCNAHHQWQHDINQSLISSTGCHRTPYTTSSVGGCEERSPEPKPRWNPKPEQIRILEAIFNSGMVNPPRDEIRKIRTQLQEYGQVGDANVFYWFQNRKSRSKHKLRHLQSSKPQSQQHTHQAPTTTPTTSVAAANTTAGPSSSSSSSEKSSPKAPNSAFSMGFSNHDVSNSPTASVNNHTFHSHNDFLAEPYFFPVHHQSAGSTNTGFCFSHLSNVVHVPDEIQNVEPCTSLLLSEIINHRVSKGDHHEEAGKVLKMDTQQLNYNVTTSPSSVTSTVAVPSLLNQIQGVGVEEAVGPGGEAKLTVFINDVAFEVAAGPFNVREAFGDEAVLVHSSDLGAFESGKMNGQPWVGQCALSL